MQQRDYTYNSRGLRTAMQINGGTWDVYGYDLTDQVTSVKYSSATNTGTTPASTLTYTYDAVGNRTQVKRTATGTTTVTNPYGTANSVNQYPTVNSASVAYDGNGNLTNVPANFLGQSSAQSASYDAGNRLLSISTSSGTVAQVYDTKNRVVSRTINGTTTYLVWDDWNLIEERDAAGNELRRYVHGADVDEILVMIDASGGHYHHHDALGNVIALTNGSGALEETYRYDAFGKVTVTNASTNATADSSFYGNRFLYTGREWMAEAGLYDYRNRVYSATLGRFLQTDPIMFASGDVNVYRYVRNEVNSLIDAYGLAEHTKGARESTRDDHERGQARKDAAQERKEDWGQKKGNSKEARQAAKNEYKQSNDYLKQAKEAAEKAAEETKKQAERAARAAEKIAKKAAAAAAAAAQTLMSIPFMLLGPPELYLGPEYNGCPYG